MQASGNFESSLIAAYLAHPWVSVPTEELVLIGKSMAKEIYNVLAENKVLLRTVDHIHSSRCDQSKKPILNGLFAEYKPFLEAHKVASRLKRELLELANSFQRNNLELFFIKSFSSLPLDSDNFDILVKEGDIARARRILADFGLVEIVWEKEPYKYLFRRVKDGEDYFAVHLHTRVAWEGHEFVNIDDLWKKRRRVKIGDVTIFMPSASHHLLITLAHAFFENRNFKLSDLVYVLESVGEVDWQYAMNRVVSDGWSKPFLALLFLADYISDTIFRENLLPHEISAKASLSQNSLAKKSIQEYEQRRLPIKISIALATEYYIRKIFSSSAMSLSGKIRATLGLLSRGMRRRTPLGGKQPAFLVCFSGIDAAGKTTHALSLWKALKEKDLPPVKYVWSRGFGQSFEPFLYFFRRILGTSPKDGYMNEPRHATVLHYEPLKKLWAHLILLDHIIQVINKVTIPLIFGNIVICDRYIQDTYVDAKCELGARIGRPVEKLTEKLVPKPDIILFLDARPKEIMGRREQHANLKEIRCKRVSYLKGLSRERFATVDVSEPLSQNKKKIVDIVLKNYYSCQK